MLLNTFCCGLGWELPEALRWLGPSSTAFRPPPPTSSTAEAQCFPFLCHCHGTEMPPLPTLPALPLTHRDYWVSSLSEALRAIRHTVVGHWPSPPCSNYINPSLVTEFLVYSALLHPHTDVRMQISGEQPLWVDVSPNQLMPSGIGVSHSHPYIRRTSGMDSVLSILSRNTRMKKAWALPWTIFAFESILYCLLASWRSDAVIRGWRTVTLLTASI